MPLPQLAVRDFQVPQGGQIGNLNPGTLYQVGDGEARTSCSWGGAEALHVHQCLPRFHTDPHI